MSCYLTFFFLSLGEILTGKPDRVFQEFFSADITISQQHFKFDFKYYDKLKISLFQINILAINFERD